MYKNDLIRKFKFRIYDFTIWKINNCNICIAQYLIK